MAVARRVDVVVVAVSVLVILLAVCWRDPVIYAHVEHVGTRWAYRLLLSTSEARDRARETYMKSPYGGDFMESAAVDLFTTNYTLPHQNWPSVHDRMVADVRAYERCYFYTSYYFAAAEAACDNFRDVDIHFSIMGECADLHRLVYRYPHEFCAHFLTNRMTYRHMDIVCSNVVVETSQKFLQQILESYTCRVGRHTAPALRVQEIPRFDASGTYSPVVEGHQMPLVVFNGNYESAMVPSDVDVCYYRYEGTTTDLVTAAKEMEVSLAPLETKLAWSMYEYFSGSEYQDSPMTTVSICRFIDESESTDNARAPTKGEWASTVMTDIIARSTWLAIHRRGRADMLPQGAR